ncbi:unnamed protein product [Merluccius merluccius]
MSNVQLSPAAAAVAAAAASAAAARRTFPLHARTGACRNLFGPVDHDELHRDLKRKLRDLADRDRQRWNFNFEADQPLLGNYAWAETPAEDAPAFYRDSAPQTGTGTGRSRIVALALALAPLPPVPRVSSPSAESGLQESPAMDVPPCCEERLVASETSTNNTTSTTTTTTTSTTTTNTTSTTRPVEVNQENHKGQLNSGIQTRSRLQLPSCVRRKRTAAPDHSSSNAHITDYFVKRRRPTETKSAESCSPMAQMPVEQTPRKRIR